MTGLDLPYLGHSLHDKPQMLGSTKTFMFLGLLEGELTPGFGELKILS